MEPFSSPSSSPQELLQAGRAISSRSLPMSASANFIDLLDSSSKSKRNLDDAIHSTRPGGIIVVSLPEIDDKTSGSKSSSSSDPGHENTSRSVIESYCCIAKKLAASAANILGRRHSHFSDAAVFRDRFAHIRWNDIWSVDASIISDRDVASLLSNFRPVIFARTEDQLATSLTDGPGNALYRACSRVCSHDFLHMELADGEKAPVAEDGNELPLLDSLTAFIKRLEDAPREVLGPGTYYLSLTDPDVTTGIIKGEEWKAPEWVEREGPLHHAVEVRVDLLASQQPEYVLQQLTITRRHCSNLPMIYTVRTRNQGGSFPDDERAAFELMVLGLRFGCEYVDVECCWSLDTRTTFLSLVKEPVSRISDYKLQELFHECAKGPPGSVDIVKVVALASDVQCSIRMHQAARSIRSDMPSGVQSIIAICTTKYGRLSRALNVMLGPTPVAHPALPAKAAPGQLSAVEIEQIRTTLGLPAKFQASKLS
eukprot:UC4_evm1s449